MLKGSKFFGRTLIIIGLIGCFAFGPSKISTRLQQKLHNAVLTTFEVEKFELSPIESNTGDDSLYRIETSDGFLGYAYLGKAPSMKDVFDYVVLFNPDLSVKKAKVLIYRENHGRQIGSQRWLKQFIGKTSESSMQYGKDIDAISGATISAKSMTKAVSEVLYRMEILSENGTI